MRRFTVLSLFPRGDDVDEDGETEDDQLTVSFNKTTSVSVFNRHEVASFLLIHTSVSQLGSVSATSTRERMKKAFGIPSSQHFSAQQSSGGDIKSIKYK